jgi:Uma2 family endonuclease
VVTECPLSTSDGVKAVDVAWLAPERRQEVRSLICLIKAPEICVEVLSSSNTPDEIAEKMALYFATGAQEVWICENGTLQFHFPTTPKIRPSSGMCPTFPLQIDL